MKIQTLLFVFLTTLAVSCNNNNDDVVIDSTTIISNIRVFSADLNISSFASNSDQNFSWGLVYGENPDPRLSGDREPFNESGNAISAEIMLKNLSPNTNYYVQVYCERDNNFWFSDEIVSFKTDTVPYKIGEAGPGGGIIYHVDPEHWAMEMSTFEYGYNDWGCEVEIEGTLEDLGAGAANMTLILDECTEVGSAPYLCDLHEEGGFSDWHLPTYYDLKAIHDSLVYTGFWTPTEVNYLSSTDCTNPSFEYTSFNAYDLIDGHYLCYPKDQEFRFFPVRRFDF